MSENALTPSEDPLPFNWERFYSRNQPPSTLGEIVVTDPRDPFLWLTTLSPTDLSENTKRVLWFTYRLNGNFPEAGAQAKLRDQDTTEDLFEGLDARDAHYIGGYMRHLARLDAETAIAAGGLHEGVPNATKSDTSGLQIVEPHDVVVAAISNHLRILRETEPVVTSED